MKSAPPLATTTHPQEHEILKSIATLRAERELRKKRQAFFGDILGITIVLGLVIATIYIPGMYDSVTATLTELISDKTYLFATAGILCVTLVKKIKQHSEQ